MAFVLQLVSGGVFFLGSLLGFLGVEGPGTVAAVIGLTLVSVFYVGCVIQAFGGRGWARTTLAVINALFVVFCLVVIVYGLNVASSTTGERVGGVVILLLLAAMAAVCTVPMFTRSAKAYSAGRRARP